MDEKNYYFIISIPKDNHIEYVTQLNSLILKLFPGKKNPYTIRPLEIRDNDTLSKVTINTTESKIVKFSQTLFGNDYMFIEQNNGDVEIVRKDSVEFGIKDENTTRH
ncbi:MAG: hypothetical protein GWM89_00235 [Candidatus Dadabacteria bacterium]|nr:hypothetical protein [Candidatus Dadabacteria bacterium]NIX14349.1 hypothetical protein [Candidatus Dadabacteria bacterium]NIY20867.1 hypothetical protein [Candidatus Dadabacteria bacterium]